MALKDVNKEALLMRIKASTSRGWQAVFTGDNSIDIDFYTTKASQGSVVAAEVLTSLCYFFRVIELLEEITQTDNSNEITPMDIINALFDCTANNFNDYQIFKFPQSIIQVLKKYVDTIYENSIRKKGEEEMKIRYCYARFSCTPGQTVNSIQMSSIGIRLLKKGLQMYPDNEHYYDLLATVHTCMKDFKSALFYAKQGLEKFPKHVNLLYVKATNIDCMNSPKTETDQDRRNIIAAYQAFLITAPADHPRAPKAYYHMACALSKLIPLKGTKMMEHYYKLGMEAEKLLLPCFLPYDNHERAAIEHIFEVLKVSASLEQLNQIPAIGNSPISALNIKPYLGNPNRKKLIVKHRQMINEMKQAPTEQGASNGQEALACKPKLRQAFPKRMSKLKSITLNEMSSLADHIYLERVIDLINIEEPIVNPTWVQLLVQDENGDVSRLFIFNEEHSMGMQEKFMFGSKITIFNPYMQVRNPDTDTGIRNDDPRCIMIMDGFPNRCRFCGNANAQLKCSICKKAWYCSKDCQQHDWKMLKHKLICSDG
ncbi:unnamed protein product [Orchesella dallaii]|uniref:MYND-type domain-containing protein n=1 Tax=Orchesella dallaii TaxID=48710 RepID=A0ABP1R5N1_9HEXA